MSHVVSSIGHAISNVFHGIGKVVSSIVSSPIGKIVAIAAAAYFTGGAALSALGADAATTAAGAASLADAPTLAASAFAPDAGAAAAETGAGAAASAAAPTATALSDSAASVAAPNVAAAGGSPLIPGAVAPVAPGGGPLDALNAGASGTTAGLNGASASAAGNSWWDALGNYGKGAVIQGGFGALNGVGNAMANKAQWQRQIDYNNFLYNRYNQSVTGTRPVGSIIANNGQQPTDSNVVGGNNPTAIAGATAGASPPLMQPPPFVQTPLITPYGVQG